MTPARMVELLDGQAAVIARLTAEVDRLTRWQNEATVVLVAWDAAWHAAGKPKSAATAATIARLTAELAAAEAEADEQAQLVEKWAWIARWGDDRHGFIDIALEAWSDMREQGQGNNT